MVDAHLRSKTIETAEIKNLIIGGQTWKDGILFCLAAVTNGDNLADPTFSWFLQYKNKNGQGKSVGLTPVYENGLVKLPWVPNKLATQVPGRMQIQLYTVIITGFLWSHPLEYILPRNLDVQKFFPLYKGENDWKIAVLSRSLPVCKLLHFACPKAFSVASLTALK